jgi:hypothetical protein
MERTGYGESLESRRRSIEGRSIALASAFRSMCLPPSLSRLAQRNFPLAEARPQLHTTSKVNAASQPRESCAP